MREAEQGGSGEGRREGSRIRLAGTAASGPGVLLLLLLLALAGACRQAPPTAPQPGPREPAAPTFAQWRDACLALPTNRQLRGRLPPLDRLPLEGPREFDRALDEAFARFGQGPLSRPEQWLAPLPDLPSFLDPERVYYQDPELPFQPFAQRLALPPGTRLWIHGDFHGDVLSLIRFLDRLNQEGDLEGFRIVPPDLRFLFLGDYTDRGSYGAEVVYTLMRLLLANPQKVILVRGNHEDISLTASYGYVAELQRKFGANYPYSRPMRLYDYLPVVLYLGCGRHYLQCNHGGMEPGYDPAPLLGSEASFQLLGELRPGGFAGRFGDLLAGPLARELAPRRPESPVSPGPLGFMWNDFTLLAEEPALGYNPGRAWVYGEEATRYLLDQASRGSPQLMGVLRAHQHSSVPNPMMRRLIAGRGIHRHWQKADGFDLIGLGSEELALRLESGDKRPLIRGSVHTFNVSPDSVYGIGCGYGFDAWGLLTVRERFEDWTLEVRSQEIIPPDPRP